jgi:hypothetical protein
VVCQASAVFSLHCDSHGPSSRHCQPQTACSGFFRIFEPINLHIDSVMKCEGVSMFYNSASSTNLPSLYLCRAENVLGSVPMMQCFVGGKKHAHPAPSILQLRRSCSLLPIPARGEATEVSCTSSTSGCGGMAGANHAMSLWQKLR